MSERMIEIDALRMTFGGIVALNDVSFGVDRGQICGLIGPNGAGKTTLFNVLSRLYQPEAGRVTLDGSDVLSRHAHEMVGLGLGRTFQNLAIFKTMTVLENVMAGAHRVGSTGWWRSAIRLGVAREEAMLTQRAYDVLNETGLMDEAHIEAGSLPYGTLKRVELARALVTDPQVLLLDEPASGLTKSEAEELGHLIKALAARRELTVLIVEHHMPLVMSISDRIIVLQLGRLLADGSPTEIAHDPAVIAAYLGASA